MNNIFLRFKKQAQKNTKLNKSQFHQKVILGVTVFVHFRCTQLLVIVTVTRGHDCVLGEFRGCSRPDSTKPNQKQKNDRQPLLKKHHESC